MISINVKELIYIIDHTPTNQNIMLVGNHGIGKSEILTNYYQNRKENPMKVVTLFLGQMSDPGDIIGLPVKDKETDKMVFAPPYWFPTDGTPIVLFLDELNRARPEILQVVQDLVLNKKLAGRSLPDGCVIISAINQGEEYTLTDIDPALLSRFNVYRFSPSVSEWIRWASFNGVNEYVIDFISSHEDMLDSKYTRGTDSTEKGVDRRSWKRVSDFMNSTPYSEVTLDKNDVLTYRKMICGIIGDSAGSCFCDFLLKGSALSPKIVMDEFEKALPILKQYDILQMMSMTVRMCIYVDKLDIEDDQMRNDVGMKLKRYIDYLYNGAKTAIGGHVSRENAQFFIGEYESGLYPNLSALINSIPELDEFVFKIIEESEC